MSELVAIIDLGSNAARFLLTRINEGVGFRILKEERVQTRLGSGPPGHLPQEAVGATLRAVHRFLGGVSNGAGPRVLAVATAAVRGVHRGHPVAFASLPLGAVRLTRRFLRHDPPTGRELRAPRGEIRAHVVGALPPAAHDAELLGLGGTVRALARMHLAVSPGGAGGGSAASGPSARTSCSRGPSSSRS